MAAQGEDTWTWGDVGDEVEARTAPVPLVVPTKAQRAKLDELQAQLDEITALGDDSIADNGATALRKQIEEISAAARRTFTVRSVGYRRWREIEDDWPPREDVDERWNIDGFVPAVLLEACDQFATEKDVEQALTVLPKGQVATLFSRARIINEGADRVPSLRGR